MTDDAKTLGRLLWEGEARHKWKGTEQYGDQELMDVTWFRVFEDKDRAHREAAAEAVAAEVRRQLRENNRLCECHLEHGDSACRVHDPEDA